MTHGRSPGEPQTASRPKPSRLSRRRFLQRSTLTSASLAALGSGLAVSPFARVLGANAAIRLGVVGIGSSVKIGGKGKQDIRDFRKIPDVRVVALCDVDRAHLDPQVEQFRKWNEKVEAYTDVRRLLENREIDGITVTTPNHWHALVTVWACQAIFRRRSCMRPTSPTGWAGARRPARSGSGSAASKSC